MSIRTFTHLTLDGVTQSPGRSDEDPRDGFPYGGWEKPYADSVMGEVAGQGMARGGSLLFGRRTWQDFAGFWPRQPADAPFVRVLNEARKLVVSTTLQEPLAWTGSVLVRDVEALRDVGEDLVVLGSPTLIRSLLSHGLLDELTVLIHPLVLGVGRRLFADGPYAALRLVDSRPTTTGVIIATYAAK